MKTKKLVLFISIMLTFVLLIGGLVACSDAEEPSSNEGGGGNVQEPLKQFEGITFDNLEVDYDGSTHSVTCAGVPEGAVVNYTNNSAKEDGVYNATAVVSKEGYETKTYSATLKINLPAQRVVTARQNSVNDTQQNYDFKINMSGSVYGATANANYDGSYRYNSQTQELKFKRVTSGALLYDAIEYIYNTGSSKIKLNANEDGVVSRMSVVPQEDEGLNLLNIPFSALVNHIEANNLSNIEKLTGEEYQYRATLALASDNETIQKLFDVIGGLGMNIAIKDVEFSNPAAGIDFYFSMNADKTLLTSFKYSANISIPLKGVPVVFAVNYEQEDNNSTITIPSTAGLITTQAGITAELNTINNAIATLKNSSSYSLDVEARNEFDPGWSTLAIVDKYIARMYKNTNEGRVDFNHSYEYKAHSEEDGAETYKYTLANIQDGSVHLVSRKGSNVITAADGFTVNTQFDYLFNSAMVELADIDCIKKVEKGGSVFYYIYTKTSKTLSIKDTVTDMINSNDAVGVVDVNNYFNSSSYDIKEAEVVVEMVAGNIVNISVETDISYVPVSGEYSEDVVTLTNSIEITVNDKATDAADYEAPENTETSLLGGLGLNNAKYYIG